MDPQHWDPRLGALSGEGFGFGDTLASSISSLPSRLPGPSGLHRLRMPSENVFPVLLADSMRPHHLLSGQQRLDGADAPTMTFP